jgi:hypothetical protein
MCACSVSQICDRQAFGALVGRGEVCLEELHDLPRWRSGGTHLLAHDAACLVCDASWMPCLAGQAAFLQIYMSISVSMALSRNKQRAQADRVAEEVIEHMADVLESPDAKQDAWQDSTLMLQAVEPLEATKMCA